MSTRHCRCGVRLARDNHGTRCAACVVTDRERTAAAPEVPDGFWTETVLRDALRSRHMGRVIRAYRTHPYHGRQPVSQEQAAAWVGLTQAQLSRIETGPPMSHLDRLIQWATVLDIPPRLLWFALPESGREEEARATGEHTETEDAVNRRIFLTTAAAIATGATVATTATGPGAAAVPGDTPEQAVEWLAWQLWQRRRTEMHRSEIPAGLARRLAAHPHVLVGADGAYRFTDPALVDVVVAQRVFGDIAAGSSHLLATAQTSHATDLTIGALVAGDDTARRGLVAWMHRGATAVLRVNAAGVLAKVGTPDLGDEAITAMRGDAEARALYLTAVASRTLREPWDRAGHLVSAPELLGPRAVERLTAELANQRDAAARWCSAVLLGHAVDLSPQVRVALGQAIRTEPCRENLRAYAAVLAGTDI